MYKNHENVANQEKTEIFRKRNQLLQKSKLETP